MGSSSFLWGPIAEIFGRRRAYNVAILILLLCSMGTALAPDMKVFVAMRVLGGFTGTFFMVAGQTVLADIFEPVSWVVIRVGVLFEKVIAHLWRENSRLFEGPLWGSSWRGLLVGRLLVGSLCKKRQRVRRMERIVLIVRFRAMYRRHYR